MASKNLGLGCHLVFMIDNRKNKENKRVRKIDYQQNLLFNRIRWLKYYFSKKRQLSLYSIIVSITKNNLTCQSLFYHTIFFQNFIRFTKKSLLVETELNLLNKQITMGYQICPQGSIYLRRHQKKDSKILFCQST